MHSVGVDLSAGGFPKLARAFKINLDLSRGRSVELYSSIYTKGGKPYYHTEATGASAITGTPPARARRGRSRAELFFTSPSANDATDRAKRHSYELLVCSVACCEHGQSGEVTVRAPLSDE